MILTAKKVYQPSQSKQKGLANQPAPDQPGGLAGPQADTTVLETEILVLSACIERSRNAVETDQLVPARHFVGRVLVVWFNGRRDTNSRIFN